MDRKREDVRDSFLDMVDNENDTNIKALETPLEVSALLPSKPKLKDMPESLLASTASQP